MKTKKLLLKIPAWVLTVAMLISLLPTTAFADSGGAYIDLSDTNPQPPNGDGWVYSQSESVYTILDGADVTVRGSNTGSQRRLVVSGNATATITFENITIEELAAGQSPLMINYGADVTLNLLENNTLKGGTNSAGIQMSETNTSLKISGSGSLTVEGGSAGAGIGGGGGGTGNDLNGNVTIIGGTVTATGGSGGAGIGGGSYGNLNGNVTIIGGTVTATGGGNGAGIGTGIGGGGYGNLNGNITISGGTVTAIGGSSGGAGIGSGLVSGSQTGEVIISGGNVTAVAQSALAQAIGRGSASGSGVTVRVTGTYDYWTSTDSTQPDTPAQHGYFVNNTGVLTSSSPYRYIRFVEIPTIYVNDVGVQDNTETGIKNAIEAELAKDEIDYIIVTGKFIDAASGVEYLIPENKLLVWNAYYRGNVQGPMLLFNGEGALSISPNAHIENLEGSPTPSLNSTALAIGADFTLHMTDGLVVGNGYSAMTIDGYARIDGGTVKSNREGLAIRLNGNAALVIHGGTIENTGTTQTIVEAGGSSVIYVDGGTVADNSIRREMNSNAIGYYKGNYTAMFDKQNPSSYGFTERSNLFSFNSRPTLINSGSGNPHNPSEKHGGTVTAILPTGFAITTVSVSNPLVLHVVDYVNNNIIFAGSYEISDITLTITGTIAGGRIPVTYITPAFGVNVATPFITTAVTVTVNNGNPLTYDGTNNYAVSATAAEGDVGTFVYQFEGINGTVYGPSEVSPTNVGEYKVTAILQSITHSGTGSMNFTISRANQATLTVDAVTGKVFGDAPFVLTSSGGSGDGAVEFTVVSGPGTISGGNLLTITGAGNIVVTAIKNGDSNYYDTPSAQRAIVIAKAEQATLRVDDVFPVTFTMPYRTVTLSTMPGSSGSGTGAVTFSVVSGPGNLSGDTLTITGAGSIVVRATKAADDNYNSATSENYTITVNKAPVTNWGFGNNLLTYSGTVIDLSTIDDLFDIDPNAGARTYTFVGSSDGADGSISGSNLTVTKTGLFSIGLVTAETQNYAAGAMVTAGLQVYPATLTITGITAADRAYNGTNTVSITGGTLEGVFSGDAVIPVVPITGTVVGSDIGNDKLVTIGAVTLTGADAGKYTLVQPTGITVNITPVEIQGIVTIASNTPLGNPINVGDSLFANITYIQPTGVTHTYEWFNGTTSLGPGNSYTVTAADAANEAEIYVVVSGTGNFMGSVTSSAVTIGKTRFSGSVNIDASEGLAVGDQLAVELVYLTPSDAEYDIRWLRNGTPIQGATAETYTITTADLGKTIEVEIIGKGSYTGSITASVGIPAIASSAPLNFRATPGDGRVTLSWNAPASDGGSAIAGYFVSMGDGIFRNVGLNTSYTFIDLTNGETYYFTVRAENSMGYGATATVTATPSAGSGGGTPVTPINPQPPAPPNTIPGHGGSEDGFVDIPITINTNTGEVSIVLGGESQETLIANAIAHAEEQNDGTTPTITLDLSEIPNAKSAVLNTEVAKALAEAGIEMTLKLPDAEITLNLAALGIIASADAGSFTVKAENVPKQNLRGMQAAQTKGYETVVSIEVFTGDTKVDVPLTVSLPYTLKQNENPAAVRVWHMADNGNLTDLLGTYDPETGMITFTIAHQSHFVVGYDPVTLWQNPFRDVSPRSWYYDAVAFANHHGLFNGYGNNRFGPQDSMTRAMFVQVLWNVESNSQSTMQNPQLNNDNNSSFLIPNSSFADVPEGAYYYKAVQWAFSNGIVEGVGGGRFAPNRAITREEMAVMLHNYATYKGIEMPAHRAMPVFTDQGNISRWATAASSELSEAGVLSGSNNRFYPQRNATRAEATQLFKNFMRFVV